MIKIEADYSTKHKNKEIVLKLLEKAGVSGIKVHEREISAQCPIHRPVRNRSAFMVRYDLELPLWTCHSCHEGGSLISLVEVIDGVSREQARDVVSKQTGFDLITVDKLEFNLHAAMECLHRKINGNTIELPLRASSQKPMYDYLYKRSKKYHRVLEVNYIVSKYNLYYCAEGRMAGRIIMPLHDENGVLVSYNDRTIVPGQKMKSMHIKDEAVQHLMYGYHENKGCKTCILVEGAFDGWQIECALRQLDKHIARQVAPIALMGNRPLSHERVSFLVSHYDLVLVMLDNDIIRSGKKAMMNNENAVKICEQLSEYVVTKNLTTKIHKDTDPGSRPAQELVNVIYPAIANMLV